MATSMYRKLCSYVIPIGARLMRHNVVKQGNSQLRGFPGRKRYTGSKFFKTAGTTVGISYALFGLSFGKKDAEDVDPLTEIYRGARLAHMRQDLQKADSLYHEGLKIADDMLKSQKITQDKFITARTLIYDGLADIALQTGQVESAETLYKETMRGCLSQGMEQSHNVMVEIALKLASIYAMLGRKEEAEEGFKFCLSAQLPKMEATEKLWRASDAKRGRRSPDVIPAEDLEETLKDTAALYGMAMSSYGRFLLYERRYSEALPLFEKARLYAEHTLGTNTNQYMVILNDIATLYIVTKNLNEAEEVLKEGITLSEKSKLEEGAMLYCNLGAVYLRKGELTSAVQQCMQGLEAAKKFDHKMAYRMAEACLKKGASEATSRSN